MSIMNTTQRLIIEILAVPEDFIDHSNGPYQSRCPMCDAGVTYKGNEPTPRMDDIIHFEGCPRSLALKLREEEYPELAL